MSEIEMTQANIELVGVGNRKDYNVFYRQCKRTQRPFIFLTYTSNTQKYTAVNYDLWPVDFDMTKTAVETIRELMDIIVKKTLDSGQYKKGAIWSSAGPVSGYVHYLLKNHAHELGLALAQILNLETNQIKEAIG